MIKNDALPNKLTLYLRRFYYFLTNERFSKKLAYDWHQTSSRFDIINKIIRNRKSVYPKDYSKKEIPKKVIEEVLVNANHAPTHRLTQPWFFKVYHKFHPRGQRNVTK